MYITVIGFQRHQPVPLLYPGIVCTVNSCYGLLYSLGKMWGKKKLSVFDTFCAWKLLFTLPL